MRVSAVIAGAGTGRRLGSALPKPYTRLLGMPLLAWALRPFQEEGWVEEVVVVTLPGWEERCREEVVQAGGFSKVRKIVAGGASRQESVCRGVLAVQQDADVIVVHDGVRPFLSARLLQTVLEEAGRRGAAVPVLTPRETLRLRGDPSLSLMPWGREQVVQVQTPQAFRAPWLRESLQRARLEGWTETDETGLLLRAGYPVFPVAGDPTNLKVTEPHDLLVAESLAARTRPVTVEPPPRQGHGPRGGRRRHPGEEEK